MVITVSKEYRGIHRLADRAVRRSQLRPSPKLAIAYAVRCAAPRRRTRFGSPTTVPLRLSIFADTIAPAPVSGIACDALRGKPIVLNFWATYCEPCVRPNSLRSFETARNTYGDDVALRDGFRSAARYSWPMRCCRERGVDCDLGRRSRSKNLRSLRRHAHTRHARASLPTSSVRHVSIGELDWNGIIRRGRGRANACGSLRILTLRSRA